MKFLFEIVEEETSNCVSRMRVDECKVLNEFQIQVRIDFGPSGEEQTEDSSSSTLNQFPLMRRAKSAGDVVLQYRTRRYISVVPRMLVVHEALGQPYYIPILWLNRQQTISFLASDHL
jgi:hypothetical protein